MSDTPQKLLSAEVTESLKSGLLGVMPGGVVYILTDGTIAAANAAAQAAFGMSYDELVDRYVAEFAPETVHEDGRPCPAEEYPVTRALMTGEPQPPMVMGFKRPDGVTAWAIVRATPVHDASGALHGALVTFLDISDRKHAEQAARHNQELLARAQSLAKVGCWEWDVDSGKVSWTDELFAIHGIARDDFQGDLESSLRPIHPDDRERIEKRAEYAMREGIITPSEYRVVHPDGSIRFVWAVAEALRDGDGKVRKLVGAIQDITARKELETQLQQMQRMETVGQLAAGVAHDFNNLLQVIMGNAALVPYDEDSDLGVAQIAKAAERAARLTEQLLTFGSRRSLGAHVIDPNTIVLDLERMLVAMLAGEVELRISTADSLDKVRVDAGQLGQVLLNLCLNARDAMPDGGSICVSTRSIVADSAFRATRPWADAERYVEIEVKDTGRGMSPEVRSRAFEPYYTTKRFGTGTGLGLSVAYGIVQQHGGMVELESDEDKGSTFHVYLPATTDLEATTTPTEVSAPSTGSETVLVVEDEPMVRDLAVRFLSHAGYEVLEAADGAEALELFRQHQERISLVFTDVVMPGIDGVQLAARLREQDPSLRILFTTGHATPEAERQIEAAFLIRKPYAPAMLLARVRHTLDC